MTIAEPVSISTVRKPFRADGMGWLWESQDGITLRVDYISDRSGEMYGEIRVTRNGKHLHLARFNLSSTTSRKTLVGALETQTRGLEIRWTEIVERFCVGVLEASRAGEQTRYTTQLSDRRRIQYLVDRLIIKGKSNMLFAPGGAGKGYLCVGICCALGAHQGIGELSVMPARPFYFDWEDDFDTYEDRLNAVARGFGVDVPSLPYRRMRGLLADRINEMARALSDAGSDFAVIDSFSAAGGTTSERTSWDTVAHRLFDALDMVPNMTWLLVDHVTGDKLNDPSGKAFGSIQKMNRVRNAWEMRSEQEAGSTTVHMKLFDAKWNHTGKLKPFGLRMDFDGDAVSFESEDPTSTGGSLEISIATRMGVQLAVRPMEDKYLAGLLKCAEGTIRTALRRNPHRFRRQEDGLIALVREDAPEDLPWR